MTGMVAKRCLGCRDRQPSRRWEPPLGYPALCTHPGYTTPPAPGPPAHTSTHPSTTHSRTAPWPSVRELSGSLLARAKYPALYYPALLYYPGPVTTLPCCTTLLYVHARYPAQQCPLSPCTYRHTDCSVPWLLCLPRRGLSSGPGQQLCPVYYPALLYYPAWLYYPALLYYPAQRGGSQETARDHASLGHRTPCYHACHLACSPGPVLGSWRL